MLTGHFYHRLKRKYVSLFGSLFNNMTFIRYDSTFTQELERVKVPITFAPKEKFMVRLAQDPDLTKSTQISLPRMSFNCVSMSYDPTRPQIKSLKMPSIAGTNNNQYMGVPYDLVFELYIMVRNIDDGNQIVEQILPTFSPDYTVSVNLIPTMGYIKDIPIILNNLDESIDYEGDFDNFRVIVWTLSFTMKAWFFGPVTDAKLIKKVFANTYLMPMQTSYITKMNVSGNGKFKLEDIVFQGNNITMASASGVVLHYDQVSHKLELGGVQGQFIANNTIRATSTNAVYTITSFDATPRKIVSIKTEPDPITANPDEDFGYTTTITEY